LSALGVDPTTVAIRYLKLYNDTIYIQNTDNPIFDMRFHHAIVMKSGKGINRILYTAWVVKTLRSSKIDPVLGRIKVEKIREIWLMEGFDIDRLFWSLTSFSPRLDKDSLIDPIIKELEGVIFKNRSQ